MANEDLYRITVSVVMIHIILMFVFEGFAFTSNNPDDSIVMGAYNLIPGDVGVDSQIDTLGLCLSGTATQDECENRGCVWLVEDGTGVCYNAIEKSSGVDFGFFDVLLSILKIPLYLGKVLLFFGSVVFFELILSFKLMPLITSTPIRFMVTTILWVYNTIILYYIWVFLSDWRGIKR